MPNQLQTRFQTFADQNAIHDWHPLWSAISTLYTTPDRHYHNIQHIADLLQKLDQWPEPCPERATIELAIWFHDIIYDPKRADNEESSAALLSHFLKNHPLQPEATSLILSTHHKETSGMKPEEIICDIDLSILGAPPEQYQKYADGVRQEYHWVPQEEFQEKRTNVLKNFLTRENIYHTKHAQSLWQTQAKTNLSQEIQTLANP